MQFNVYNLLSHTAKLFKKKCDLKGLNLQLIISQNVPEKIYQDEEKI